MKKTLGEVRGDVAVATAHLLRVWAEMPPVAQLDLREVAPELVHALDGWHAAQVALLAAKQEQSAVDVARALTARAHSIPAARKGMA